ncbi:alpha-1,6-glucosidase domain-containing protein [Catenovulum adriaticum]|uniref:DUF3372 domain-containing protein n=1 Tax=Catenovulum adriaticum TaxID=2984846 RepID=A0ABY7AQD2_9ALTE|nr:alpha-1,6-glucosidase domain-containing protein [Catenovulum sp. TS8]WAJ70876.1 DUF3372 domain-containing protein [Catenovulum sp. TS8]
MKLNQHFSILPLAAFVSMSLVSCGESEDIQSGAVLLTCDTPMVANAAGTECVAPEAKVCPFPSVPDATNEVCVTGPNPEIGLPAITPNESQAILYYNRGADDYNGWKLHTWNNETCDSLADTSVASSWNDGLIHNGVDPVFGAYWILDLKAEHGDCINFIVHKGDEKDLGSSDKKLDLTQPEADYARMGFAFKSETTIFKYPLKSLGDKALEISESAAHLIDANTLVWDLDTLEVAEVKLHHSAMADIEVADSVVSGDTVSFTETDLTDAQIERAPVINAWAAFANDLTADEAKNLLKSQLVAVAYDADGIAIDATWVQTAKALDALYTMADNDANEAVLGTVYENGIIQNSVWAPTAQQVMLKVYDANKTELASHAMNYDEVTGIWSYQGDSADLDRKFYQYEVTVYHYTNQQIETLLTSDPYSVSLSTNGEFSQFVNLNDPDLKPTDWETHAIPTIENIEDAVLLEAHIRDFSINDETVSAENRGKYLAFTETDSNSVKYLKRLADAGVTHFHMLPANDIATIEEDTASRIDLTNSVAELCEVKTDAAICGVENETDTLWQVLEAYVDDYEPKKAQTLITEIKDIDGFNWGYDPHHFNAPEGSYASNPDGVTRIIEMREMNQALHKLGLRVVLDVVYNHTSASGLWDNSVFDKVVPGYYHRRNEVSGNVENSSCCDNTATENQMFDKFIQDSLVLWTEAYKFDGFRFDIMGHIPKSTLLEARDKVAAIDPDTYFYGEGWNFGEDVQNDRLFEQARQDNMGGSEIGTFNDRPRDDIRNAALFNQDGSLDSQDYIRLGLAGTLADFPLMGNLGNVATGSSFARASYALDPADVINYVSKHDNETLWDQLQYGLPESYNLAERVRAHNIAASIPVLSQGIPFFQLGVDLMRSKSMDRDSYNSGDWFNYIDLSMQQHNWNIGLPPAEKNEEKWDAIAKLLYAVDKPSSYELEMSANVFAEFLQIRDQSPLMRLTNAQDIIDRVGFHNVGARQTQGLIVMSIDDGSEWTDIDPNLDAMLIVINGSNIAQSHTIATASGFELHSIQQNSYDSVVTGASFTQGEGEGTFDVPALTTAVFVKPQGDAQGAGLSAQATQGAPDVVPFGDTPVYLKGDMNGWSNEMQLSYVGNGIYQTRVELMAGQSYGFKLADADWASIIYGAAEGADGAVAEGTDKTLSLGGGTGNLSFTPDTDATYIFSFDASDKDAVVLNIVNEEPFVGVDVLLRGDMNGWSETDAFVYQGGRIYILNTSLAAGTYGFKIADAQWGELGVNFGAESEAQAQVELAEAEYLASTQNNLSITLAEDAELVFIFDMTNLEPKLRVYKANFFADTPVFIRGGMNDWGEVDQLSYNNDGTYSVDLTLAAGDYEFKIASADWSTVDLGAVSENVANVELAVDEQLAFKGDNMTFTADSDGIYRFLVEGPDGANPNLTISLLP